MLKQSMPHNINYCHIIVTVTLYIVIVTLVHYIGNTTPNICPWNATVQSTVTHTGPVYLGTQNRMS